MSCGFSLKFDGLLYHMIWCIASSELCNIGARLAIFVAKFWVTTYENTIMYHLINKFSLKFDGHKLSLMCRFLKTFHFTTYISGAGFTNDLRETLSYGKLLKHRFYPILRNYG